MSGSRATLSLVVPVFFEEDCIVQFLKETGEVLQTIDMDYEYVFVDDGSKDRTIELIRSLAHDDHRIKLIEFSYNHGKQAAVTAGIEHATGDYLLYMDPDLQDPPEEIPRFIAEISKGYDLVMGVRRAKMDSFANRLFSRLFWWVLERFTGLAIPRGLAVMRIFNRRFADQFLLYREQNRFIEGIFLHIGMHASTLVIDQRERFAGTSKFNFRRKMRLALDAILDFSELPLKVAVKLGAMTSCLGVLAVLVVIALKLTMVDFQAGWPSLLSLLMLGFGAQLFFIGIAALYIGRIYRETKQRPLYSIRRTTNLQPSATKTGPAPLP
ncbi:glycosyltransferase family 2 protein [Dyella sp.]|jgi:dolichol-phosphate mannosyltransferase|uniref:glycosyltransferase family 2 protein n=1 Tax=Dyella sp. TaxID=1869338 RepID=UPI002D77131D|nr:glycosyltransferase family 2 protein [Dyella sp.]HET6430807.1 glycosyltransferase family 2 protein [Dyella sp.]